MNTGSSTVATVVLAKPEPPAPLRISRVVRRLRTARHWDRTNSSIMIAVATVSLAVLTLEFVRPAVSDATTVRATVETVMTLFALVAAWLLRVQFAQSRRWRDLLLLAAVLTLGLVRLCWHAVPAVLDLHSPSLFAAAARWGALSVAAIFALSAFARADDIVAGGRRAVTSTVALCVGLIGMTALAGLLTDGKLAGGIHHAYGIAAAAGDPLALTLALAATILFGVSTVGFLLSGQQAARDGEAAWLAGAALLLAAARLSDIALNPLAADLIAPAELLMVLAVGLLLGVAIRRELAARKRLARAAAMAERQRVARDLHDGLAQDLAFIAAHGERFAAEMGEQHPVVIAARRALAVSRSTIAELSDPAAMTVQDALEALAQELRDRFGISIAVDAPAGHLSAERQEDVSRIAREAIANAARHGGAKNVMVSLTRSHDALRLRVSDDGCGIQGAGRTTSHAGLGLRSMHERAEAAGGQMTIRRPGKRGTELEVVLP